MASDYYAVYRRQHPRERGCFFCHAFARDAAHALTIARQQGLPVPRHSFAVHIGRAGYYASLAAAFR